MKIIKNVIMNGAKRDEESSIDEISGFSTPFRMTIFIRSCEFGIESKQMDREQGVATPCSYKMLFIDINILFCNKLLNYLLILFV